SLDFGAFRVSDPIFTESKFNSLSLHYLSRYNVTFDFPNKRLYVQKSQAFDKRDERNMSGLHFLYKQGTKIVESVDSESAAEKAGLRAGDRILTVGDKTVDNLRMYEFERLFSQEASAIKVTIDRDGKQIDSSIRIK